MKSENGVREWRKEKELLHGVPGNGRAGQWKNWAMEELGNKGAAVDAGHAKVCLQLEG